MARLSSSIDLPSLRLIDRGAGELTRQLAQRLREAMIAGELKPGERLPSTRTLARSLGLARGTVVEAFDQLVAEGFLVAAVGSGTRVADELGGALPSPAARREDDNGHGPLPEAASRLAAWAGMLAPAPATPFAIAVPSSGVEPNETWRRLSNRIRATRHGRPEGYGDPQGVLGLRCAIAEHVRRFRAVTCGPENVVVTTGAQQALYMASQVLLSPGDIAWAEDPAYPGLTTVLDHLGAATHRVPVDDQGFRVDEAIADAPDARAAFVTPSHQYPLGMPLSMGRRQALVAWAVRNRRWIVEDDYDSELRYAGHPFPAMQGMAPERVVYLGTFSKVMFPSLRLGYVVAPTALVNAFLGAHALIDRHAPTGDQHVLAAYMREGLLEAHVRRIRGLYGARRAALLEVLSAKAPEGCRIQPSAQGMHVLLWLPPDVDDVALAEQLGADGLWSRPISPMYANVPARPGLMLGFGGFAVDELVVAAERLAMHLTAALPRRHL